MCRSFNYRLNASSDARSAVAGVFYLSRNPQAPVRPAHYRRFSASPKAGTSLTLLQQRAFQKQIQQSALQPQAHTLLNFFC